MSSARLRPERSWPPVVHAVRRTGTPAGRDGEPERFAPPRVLGVFTGLAGGVPAPILCWVRGPAGRRLIGLPSPRRPMAAAALAGDRIGSLLLQRLSPVLIAPPAGVGGINAAAHQPHTRLPPGPALHVGADWLKHPKTGWPVQYDQNSAPHQKRGVRTCPPITAALLTSAGSGSLR